MAETKETMRKEERRKKMHQMKIASRFGPEDPVQENRGHLLWLQTNGTCQISSDIALADFECKFVISQTKEF